MAEGLPPLEVNIMELDIAIPEDDEDWEVELPPNFMLISALGMEPKLLNATLSGPNMSEWQTALDYDISQLEKLGMWVIEDLLKGHTAISCSTMTVLKEKHGPDGEIMSYWVHIIAGRHRQVEGVNYSEMFSSVVKMPAV